MPFSSFCSCELRFRFVLSVIGLITYLPPFLAQRGLTVLDQARAKSSCYYEVLELLEARERRDVSAAASSEETITSTITSTTVDGAAGAHTLNSDEVQGLEELTEEERDMVRACHIAAAASQRDARDGFDSDSSYWSD
jgi:hypothetical protein